MNGRLVRSVLLRPSLPDSAAARHRARPPPAGRPRTPRPTADSRPYERRGVDGLLAILSGGGDYAGFFAPGFKAQVPKAMFDQVTAQLIAANGKPGAILGGAVRVRYGTAIAVVMLVVDPAPPHQVTGLLVTGFEAEEKTLAEVEAALGRLRGDSGYAIARLGTGAPQLIAGRNADTRYAIGSAFKLVILAELVRLTNKGERKWDDLVTLDGGMLPGGGYTTKPKGTQVSLRELATQMISISDNSATDILLHHLGRQKVEAMMPVLGIADPARNRPFLGALDMFRLKGVAGLADRYLKLDEAGRRAMLDGEVAGIPPILIDITSFRTKTPKMIDTLEWFESPNDLVRVMDWLRRNTEGPAGADARAILSKNPGLGPDARGKWQWAGFKGGSEPGVMNLTYLLQARGGDWYVVTASWNDPQRDVEEGRFVGLLNRAVALSAP
uniref:Beta-lactamase2 domain-containing protein n=1 Tax=Globodera pallida TaxID=36090 RepID=A0A183C8B1_GLOPA